MQGYGSDGDLGKKPSQCLQGGGQSYQDLRTGELADEKRQYRGGIGEGPGEVEQHTVGDSQKEIPLEMLAGKIRLCQGIITHFKQVTRKKRIVKKRKCAMIPLKPRFSALYSWERSLLEGGSSVN